MVSYINIVGFPFLQLSVDQVAEMIESNAFPIKLTPEPENTYDPNAIAIYRGFNRIGYVAKDS